MLFEYLPGVYPIAIVALDKHNKGGLPCPPILSVLFP